jgi:polar amino acid transport system substrate-binding protein
MQTRRIAALVATFGIALAACSGGATATPEPTEAPSVAPESQAPASEAPSAAPATPIPGGLLDVVTKAGKLRVSTDPNYAPQSALTPEGTYEGFDIDVATEIAKRMGVAVEFTPQKWEIITAGSWAGRWDASVGSMTITADREKAMTFSVPYYFTPVQMAVSKASGITTIEGLAGKTVCAGAATTYYSWLSGLPVDMGSYPQPTTTPPPGVKVVTLQTDADCAQQWAAGRNDFEGWLTAQPTVEEAIKQNQPVVAVGDPVYYEPLAVALDKSGPDPSDFVAKLDEIITAMHDDGTLTELSMKWYGKDLTKAD